MLDFSYLEREEARLFEPSLPKFMMMIYGNNGGEGEGEGEGVL